MKNIIFLLLFLPFLTLAQENRTGKVFEAVNSAKAISGEFQSFEIFSPQTRSATTNYSEGVKDGVIATIDQSKFNTILEQKPQQMRLTIPFKSNGENVVLDLIQVSVFSPDFKAVTNTGQDITNEVDFGVHYRGVIAGNTNSLVSISVFENQINGFIANTEGNYTIGKLKDSDNDHIIYKDSDLKATLEFTCATEDDGVGYTTEELSTPRAMDPGDIIDIYIESTVNIYNANGENLANTVAFLTSLYAQAYVLYANDGILARTSSMMVWVSVDPYNTGGSVFSLLPLFQIRTFPGQLDADIGQLIKIHGGQGIAAGITGICPTNTDESLSVAGIYGLSFPNVPIYSWSVMVIAHEIGHLMGSRHTHACVWNGDNTAIDSCAPVEGSCPSPGYPAGGGTIMSYCMNQSVGIDFNLGFGAQPTAVILNNINANGNCLNPASDPIPPTPVCKSLVVTLDSNGEATIDVDDIDGGSFDDDGIDSMSIDIDSFDCDDVGEAEVTLTVTDTDGLTSTCIAFVQVIDDTEIVDSGCPEDFEVTVNTGSSYELLDYRDDLTAISDNCNYTFLGLNQSPSAGTQLAVGVHTITVSGLLNDGTIVSCSFDITVVDGLGIGDNTSLSSLVLYPNPTSELVQLSNPQNLDLETISIYDMMGRLIKLVDLNDMGSEMSIDISDLADSNYFAIIQGSQNKIVKQLIKR